MSSSLQLGIVERYNGLHLIPERCPLQAVCGNFPRCWDIGYCQTFKDERVSIELAFQKKDKVAVFR